MSEMMDAFVKWVDMNDFARSENFQDYVHNIAQARFVTRRVLRVINDSAKEYGLEPLQHQALLQIYGASGRITVHQIADQLDVAAAFASRLVKHLEERGLVRRSSSADDRRVIEVTATEAGVELLKRIDGDVHYRVAYFQRQIVDEQ